MPPKFVRYSEDVDILDSQNAERVNLLKDTDESGSDEDFFLNPNRGGPRVAGGAAAGMSASNQPPVHYSSGPSALNRVRGEVKEVVDIMKVNVGKVLQRGENLEELYDKSERLSTNSDEFRTRSRTLGRALWWRDCRMKLLLASVVIVLLLIIIIPIVIQQSKSDDDGS